LHARLFCATFHTFAGTFKRCKVSGVKRGGRTVIAMSLYTAEILAALGECFATLNDFPFTRLTGRYASTSLTIRRRHNSHFRRGSSTMRLLGVQIARVSTGNSMAPTNWRLLAADDLRLDYFLVRDVDTRL